MYMFARMMRNVPMQQMLTSLLSEAQRRQWYNGISPRDIRDAAKEIAVNIGYNAVHLDPAPFT